MTQLHHLSFRGCLYLQGPPPGYLTALSALNHLDVSATSVGGPLGAQHLLHLEELIVSGCAKVPDLPENVPSLRLLEAAEMEVDEPDNLYICIGLRKLNLNYSKIRHPASLSRLTGLEVLKLADYSVVGKGVAAGRLGCLSRRHLDLNMSDCGHAAAFASPGSLPHLTFLDVTASMADPAAVPRDWKHWVQRGDPEWSGSEEEVSSIKQKKRSKGCRSREEALSRRAAAAVEGLMQLGPLSRLRELNLALNQLTSLAPLGPWLAQCSALTQLNLSDNPLASPQELDHLPALPQLQVLRLDRCGLTRLPRCLTRLTGLNVLLLNDNPQLQQLPGWLSQLQRLEVLELKRSGVVMRQAVLRYLPLLRSVELVDRDRTKRGWEEEEYEVLLSRVYGRATHLHWGWV